MIASAMPTTLTNARQATMEEWDAIHAACPYATFFHGRSWAQVLEEYTDGRIRPEPRHLHFSDGVELILPISIRTPRHRLWRTALLSPAGTYGGPISLHEFTDTHAMLVARYMKRRLKNCQFRSNPYLETTIPPIGSCIPDTTQRIRLSDFHASSLELQNRGHRSATAKARKSGIEIVRATEPRDWTRYAAMYEQSVARWGKQATSHWSPRLFQILQRNSATNGDIQLWLAHLDGKPVAGAILLCTPTIDIYWHGSALAQFFDLRPVNLLLTELLDNAKRGGKSWFDFNPSGGHDGVVRFKDGFGPARSACPMNISRSPLARLAKNASELLPIS